MTAYLSGPHSAAFVAAVEALWGRVGDAQAPRDVSLPYCIVYPLGSSTFDGTNAPEDLSGDAFPVWQVTSVGGTREQTEWLRDKVRAGLLGTYLPVAGRLVGPVLLDDEQPVQLDTDVTPYLMHAIDRFRIYSTSS